MVSQCSRTFGYCREIENSKEELIDNKGETIHTHTYTHTHIYNKSDGYVSIG